MKKKRIVFWSGGLDSTYLIQKSLEEGYLVTACYINIENNTNKVVREKEAIERLLPHFNKSKNFNYINELLNVNVHPQGIVSFYQFPIFMLGMMYCMNEYDEIALAYVMNDDFVSYQNEAIKLFNAARLFSISDHKCKLVFPLIKKHKFNIIESLDNDLINLVTFCESQYAKDFCGTCTPCKKMKSVDERLYNTLHEKYHDNLVVKNFTDNGHGDGTEWVNEPTESDVELLKTVIHKKNHRKIKSNKMPTSSKKR
jgi:7-cyano-7-deazaguanine synthase in queuosine biosynthesis